MPTDMPKDEARITARFTRDETEALENWRRAQPRIPPMSTALRMLTLRALQEIETVRREENAE